MEPTNPHQELSARSGALVPVNQGRSRSQYPGESEFDDSDSGGLVEYWRILRRNRGTLLVITFLGLCAAILITLPQTPIYQARAAFEIQNVNNDFLNTKQVTPVSDSESVSNVLTDVQTQMKILQTQALMDRVIDKLKAEGKLGPLGNQTSHIAAIRSLFRLNTVHDPDADDYAMRQKAMKSFTVRQLGQTRVIEVLFSSPNPKFAALFLNTLGNEYIEANMEGRWKMSERTGEWLSGQLNEMRIKLERSEDSLQEYARRSGLLFTTPPSGNSDKTNVSEDKLRQLQEELSKAMADRANAQSRYEIAKAASPDTVGDVLNDQPLRDLQARLTDLRRERADMITTYTAKHEKVKRIEAQIEPLQIDFDSERQAIVDHIRNEYDSALRREKLLKADYDAQTTIVTDQADKSIQYNILKRDVDSNRSLYESMLQQVKEASIAAAIRASNIRMVDPAKAPRKPFSPDYPLNSALGVLAGLLTGVGFVVVRERADRTLQEPGDTPFWTNLPELGIIPSGSLDSSSRSYYAPFSKVEPQAFDTLNPSNGGVELVSLERKPSMLAESFRTVLTSIMFSGDNGTHPQVLVLTSANPMDGKTTVVSNLGIALAEIRKKVLIIDGDLRKPRMHQLFDIDNSKGLSDLLRATAINPEYLDAHTQKTSVPGLTVLPSGPPTHAAANLLYSPHMHDMLRHFREIYDLVLIDTPPTLQMTDARVLARLSDAVILVVRAGKTTREAAVAIRQRFSEDRSRILGTVLNDWNPKKSPKGYYGYYNRGYYPSYNAS